MFRKFILHFTKNSFCKIFNIKSFLLKRKVRLSYQNKNKFYFAEELSERITFCHRKQGLYSYSNGIIKRINTIKNDYLLKKISFQNKDCIIDVGANVGDFYQYFKYIHCNINYFAFEPSKEEYRCLKINTKGHLYNIGLWKCKDTLSFFSASETADSSFIKPLGYDKIMKLNVNRLDNIIKNRKIKLLKLEAEGAEIEVLQGSLRLLKKIEYITADLGYERGEKSQSTLIPVTNYLLKRNFKIIDFNPNRVVALFKNTEFK
tara:strand:- start:1142 stop:1924 length:783 start_codon:yes stop_codon:yes gene_type:complete